MIGFDALASNVLNKIKTQSTKINSNYVFDGAQPSGGYPAAVLYASDVAGQFADTQRDLNIYHFTVSVYQERINTGAVSAEQIVRQAVDELTTILDGDIQFTSTAGATVLTGTGFCKPIAVKFGYTDIDNVNCRVADITLEIHVVQ